MLALNLICLRRIFFMLDLFAILLHATYHEYIVSSNTRDFNTHVYSYQSIDLSKITHEGLKGPICRIGNHLLTHLMTKPRIQGHRKRESDVYGWDPPRKGQFGKLRMVGGRLAEMVVWLSKRNLASVEDDQLVRGITQSYSKKSYPWTRPGV